MVDKGTAKALKFRVFAVPFLCSSSNRAGLLKTPHFDHFFARWRDVGEM